jgi:2-oxoisovalerate dehydrogenase E1 component
MKEIIRDGGKSMARAPKREAKSGARQQSHSGARGTSKKTRSSSKSTSKSTGKTSSKKASASSRDYFGLKNEDLIDLFKNMVLSRLIDDTEIRLRKQNQVFFQISGAGHEGALVAAGKAFRSKYDWFFGYYRDRALMLQLGQKPIDHLLQATGAQEDPNSRGRQMPCHWGDPRFNIVSKSSNVGTQFNQAVGCAEAGLYNAQYSKELKEFKNICFEKDEVVYVSTGDGTTSQGEFWEALNVASNRKLPVVFHVEDNGYAISVPRWLNTAGDDITELVKNFPHLAIYNEVDGTKPLDCYKAFKDAVEHCRKRKGPAIVRTMVTRPYSHSLSDDQSAYRTKKELEDEKKNDCIDVFAQFLQKENILSKKDLDALKKECKEEVDQAAEKAIEAEKPDPSSALDYIYSEDPHISSETFEGKEDPSGEPIAMAGAINKTLHDEMKKDSRILIFGEDVADASNEENLETCKGKGGVFKLTHGLQSAFGSDRVFNSPLAEANIVGRGIGMATRGLKPVVEIQFFDYIWPAFMQMRNEMGLQRFRSGGTWTCPMVVRAAYGGYLKGGAIYHSQTGEAIFAHSPGIRVAIPSNARDAAGLLRTSIRCDDPVLFLEHKHLYYQGYNRAEYPGPDFMIPFGKAAIKKEGSDCTLVTYGATVQKSLEAAQKIEKDSGASIEVIDLRTVQPLDMETIEKSLKKTSRLMIVHEEMRFTGMGAEIAAEISEKCFEMLDAPPVRVGALDTHVAYSPVLENAILPQMEDIKAAAEKLLRY